MRRQNKKKTGEAGLFSTSTTGETIMALSENELIDETQKLVLKNVVS